jgi:hypothetical protein
MLKLYGWPKVAMIFLPGGGTDMELLIRTVDKTADETASKRGDVIVFQPDGFVWSALERSNQEWIIVTAQITEVEAEALTEGPRTGEPNYKRRVGVNIDGLHAGDVLTRNELMSMVF